MKRNKKKPNIKKLVYPKWLSIVFYVLTIIGPLVTIMIQGFMSPSKPFRITFGLLAGILVAWTFVDKFILKKFKAKIDVEKVQLEHDYSIEVGNPKKCEYLWYTNELWIVLFNFTSVALLGTFILLLIYGAQTACIKLTGTSTIIVILFAAAYATKFIYLFTKKDKLEEHEEVENTETNNDVLGSQKIIKIKRGE